MLDVVEKLLILQDRDRKINRVKQELNLIPIERQQLTGKASQSQAALDAAKQTLLHLESERKRFELDVESKKQQIDKYGLQQFQTRKNEEFRALGHEIDNTRKDIFEVENNILEVMEQTETAQKKLEEAKKEAAAAKKLADEQIGKIDDREKNLRQQLAELDADRAALASAVDESTLARYERMLKTKGDSVIVSIERGVCNGCHMQLSRQTVVDCRAAQNIATCLNCGRILYYTPDMDVSTSD